MAWASGPARDESRLRREQAAQERAARARAQIERKRQDEAAAARASSPSSERAEPAAPAAPAPETVPPPETPAASSAASTDPTEEAGSTAETAPASPAPAAAPASAPSSDPKPIHKPLTKYSAGSWMVWDMPDVAVGAGLVAAAPGLLQSEGKLVARTFTYQLAMLDEHRSGAVGGIKASPDALGDEGAAWSQGVSELIAADRWTGYAANFAQGALDGVALLDGETVFEAEAASLRAVITEVLADDGPARVSAIGLNKRIVVALAELAAEGRVKLVAASSPSGTLASPDGLDLTSLSAALDAHPTDWLQGIDETTGPAWGALSTPCDVLLVGRTLGLTHEFQERVLAKTVIGVTDGAVSPRALAQLQRRGIVVWSDLVATLGRVVALLGGGPADAFGQTAAIAHAVGSHVDGPTIGTFEMAEATLRGWHGDIPVSRPLP